VIIADQYRDIVGDRPATKIIQLCVSFFLFVVSVSVGVFFSNALCALRVLF